MERRSSTHHRRSIRLPAYDYSETGAYFVTICTFERGCLLSDAGVEAIVRQVWRHLSRRDHVTTDEFVVMPNHVHGIIWIRHPDAVGAQHALNQAHGQGPDATAKSNGRPLNRCAAPLHDAHKATTRLPPRSLGTIVRAFKAATSRRINESRGTPGAPVWQRNYYEHVIRDDGELERIQMYILENPLNWAEDPDNPANITPAIP